MLQLNYIREKKEEAIQKLAKKGFDATTILAEVITLDDKRKSTQAELDSAKARVKSNSVIDCDYSMSSIRGCIDSLFEGEFKDKIENAVNPYGSGGAAKKIMNILENKEIPYNTKKTFFNYQ